MKNPYPKSKSFKNPDPGQRAGLASMPKIKSGPTVKQSFVNGRKGNAKTAAFGKAHPGISARGSARIAQGGEKESGGMTGITRTNMGRQRL